MSSLVPQKNAVSFINRGLIDLRAVRTFGMSAKETENPIGFFGTGFKYAVAICLRLGCTVTMYRGLERIDFDTGHAELRGQSFNVVRMTRGRVDALDSEELAFTTELGKTWEAWQAFRELYCNALDEGGSVWEGDAEPAEDHTTIVVAGEPIYAAYIDRANIVLQNEPRYALANLHVHERHGHHGYYRGIRAAKFERHACFTYNVLKNLDLTEDRTIKNIYSFNGVVRDAVLTTTDVEFARAWLLCPRDTFEAMLDLDCSWTKPSEQFLQACELVGFRDIANASALKVFRKHRKIELVPDATPLNKIETMQLARAIRFVEFMGYKVQEFPVVVTADLDDHVWGRAYEGRIYINRSAFAHGTKVVAGTLIEEYIHLRHKLDDESRQLQNHLLNALVSMGELAYGEPV